MTRQRRRKAQFHHVQVDVVPGDDGLILSVGAVSLLLTKTAAKQVVAKLAGALGVRPLRLIGGVDADAEGPN
jgi:hypothetical protein